MNNIFKLCFWNGGICCFITEDFYIALSTENPATGNNSTEIYTGNKWGLHSQQTCSHLSITNIYTVNTQISDKENKHDMTAKK